MENKEIYIDGVNVARCCKCYNVEQKILCGASGICANNPNCYYKQLQRLEQENKELKKKLELDEVQLESYFIGEEKICKKNEKYRSALEEINRTLLGVRGLSIHCDKQIIKAKVIINEVLNA